MIPTSREIRASLLAVFRTDDNLNADPYNNSINLSALVSMAIARMNVQPHEFKKVAEKIKSHINRSSNTDKSPFILTHGAKGGVQLRKGARL